MDVRSDRILGTWFLAATGTVTLNEQQRPFATHGIMTFTRDGGVVERAERRVEAGIGVWEAGDEEDQFRVMFYRLREKLTVNVPTQLPTPPPPSTTTSLEVSQDFGAIERVRSTIRLTRGDAFTGTSSGDALDDAAMLIQ